MPSSGMACRIRATSRGGAMGSAQSSVPRVMCSAICRDMYAKYLYIACPPHLLRHMPPHIHSVTVPPHPMLLRSLPQCVCKVATHHCHRSEFALCARFPAGSQARKPDPCHAASCVTPVEGPHCLQHAGRGQGVLERHLVSQEGGESLIFSHSCHMAFPMSPITSR